MLRDRGFTIVEILIAMTVLSVGLLGILAVFPAGIKKTAEVVEDTYAAMITESVRNAVQLGLQHARIDDGSDKGFVYTGEGVQALLDETGDTLPTDITTLDGDGPDIDRAADYWVKVPYDSDKVFLYPRHDPTSYEMGPDTPQEQPPVQRVFPCGTDIVKIAKNPSLSTVEREEALKDVYQQYSYAFTLKEAKAADPSGHSLYELTILIYRNFPVRFFRDGNDAAGYQDRNHQPVKKPARTDRQAFLMCEASRLLLLFALLEREAQNEYGFLGPLARYGLLFNLVRDIQSFNDVTEESVTTVKSCNIRSTAQRDEELAVI
jgi:prepilin-type N-terminal cleavage/methylation domain-containing protein